jgi:hypothetical protein
MVEEEREGLKLKVPTEEEQVGSTAFILKGEEGVMGRFWLLLTPQSCPSQPD